MKDGLLDILGGIRNWVSFLLLEIHFTVVPVPCSNIDLEEVKEEVELEVARGRSHISDRGS